MQNQWVQTNNGITKISGIKGFTSDTYPSSPHGNMALVEQRAGGCKNYADFICYSGFAFKTGWHTGFCPSAGHPACGFFCLDLQEDISDWEHTVIPVHNEMKENPGKEDEVAQQISVAVKESIDRGLPVHYEKEEDGIIIGYRDEGKKWLCLHPYYKDGKEEFWYDEADGFAGGVHPWILRFWRTPKEPNKCMDENELLIRMLQRVVDIWNAGKLGDYFCGKMAYEHWVQWLEDVQSGDIVDPESGMQGNAWCMYVLSHSRAIAAEWLKLKSQLLLDSKVASSLLSAAEEYAKIKPVCVAGYQSTWDFAKFPAQVKEWTEPMRTHQITALRESMLCDQKAVQLIEKALPHVLSKA